MEHLNLPPTASAHGAPPDLPRGSEKPGDKAKLPAKFPLLSNKRGKGKKKENLKRKEPARASPVRKTEGARGGGQPPRAAARGRRNARQAGSPQRGRGGPARRHASPGC